MHITSLPGRGGVGSLGMQARAFVDFLANAGQSWWQVLPLSPPAKGNSPYSAYSVFAGNPALINLELLEEDGLLAFWARNFQPEHRGERAHYEYCTKIHLPLLRQAFQNEDGKHGEAVERFRRENAFWIEDYALYMVIRNRQGDLPAQQWPAPLLRRDPEALETVKRECREEIHFWVWTQYQFYKQWDSLRQYARKKGIGIIGDLPLYPALDSADVWANPRVFQLDEDSRPTLVAGVPPDAFTQDGQLWGNPLYDWDALRGDGYRWWIERFRLASQLFDQVRIDHFRGLDEYYAIPAQSKTARNGVWRPGPGMDLLRTLKQEIPHCRLIAEDLGLMTPGVRKLLADSNLPGMKVLQFAFDPSGGSDHLPHKYARNTVGYTGTHDNDTVMGWVRSATPEQRMFARSYLKLSRREGYHWGFIRGLYASGADTAVVPMQDFLGLGSEARMNIPGEPDGHWGWRLDQRLLTKRLAARMRELAALYGRIPDRTAPPV